MTAITILSLGFVLVITGVIWYYLRFIGPYLKLPTSFAIFVDCTVLCINSLLRRGYAKKNILQKIKEMGRKYEKEGLFVAWIGQPTVMIFGPKYVKQILNDSAAIYKPNVYNIFTYFLRSSIFISSGEEWKRQKKILTQAFQFSIKQKKIQIVNKYSGNLLKTLSRIPNNTTNEILDILKHSTLQVMIESFFGEEINLSQRSFMIETLEKVSSFTVERLLNPWLYPDFSLNIFPEGRKCVKSFKTCIGILLEGIETWKENMLSSNQNFIDMKPEFAAEALLKKHLQDPSFTMDELTQQIFFTIIAAFDTTSLTLMWCLHLLGLHEEVQERIFSEVEEFNEELCDEDLRKMDYTECVIQETLRMYSTAPVIFKYLDHEVQCGKYTIPKGSTVCLNLSALHKNPDMFPEPEKFDPERFRQTKNGDSSQLYTASFAEGLRPCLGKADALIQLKIMIAYIVRNFKVISLDKQKEVEVCFELLLTAGKPLQMQFIPRSVIKDEDIFSTTKIENQSVKCLRTIVNDV